MGVLRWLRKARRGGTKMQKEYAVESIGKGRKTGQIKIFSSKQDALSYAQSQYQTGKGVAVDELRNGSQRPIAQKGLEQTGLSKGKYGKETTQSFGSLSPRKRKPIFGGFGTGVMRY